MPEHEGCRRRLLELLIDHRVPAKTKRLSLDEQRRPDLEGSLTDDRVSLGQTVAFCRIAGIEEALRGLPHLGERLLETLPCTPERCRLLGRDLLLGPP